MATATDRGAFYNDNDRFAAAWLSALIDAGHLTAGTVDGRSIKDVQATDLLGYRRVHLFAGIAGWEYALRLAGWGDEPIWTGSCPCQPFSSAGRGGGERDARHLWPEMRRLIAECRPSTVLGEQVASRLGREWLAGVRADLEALGYRFGAADLCAAGTAAPHIRQRLFWVADAHGQSQLRRRRGRSGTVADQAGRGQGEESSTGGPASPPGNDGSAGRLGHPVGAGREGCRAGARGESRSGADREPVTASGAWGRYDVIPCRDGKNRRIESGTFPLVDGAAQRLVRGSDPGTSIDPDRSAEARVMRLRGYGGSIIPQMAAVFIRAFMEARK